MPPALAVGANFTASAAQAHADLGSNATGLKVSADNLLVMKQSYDSLTPQQMIDPVEQGGLGLQMTLEQAQGIKDALAEVPAISEAINAAVALSRCWGSGI